MRAAAEADADRREHPFWQDDRPWVIAHRGFAVSAPENTLSAFQAALDAGATHLESDAQATKDGVAVLLHDHDLQRVAGVPGTAAQLTLEQLQRIPLPGGERVPSLAEFLTRFPEAKLNLDVKSKLAVAPVAAAIAAADAGERVLIASFSRSRRLATLRRLGPETPTSASGPEIALAVIALFLGVAPLARRLLRRVDAVQIPERILGIDVTAPRMLQGFRGCGVEIHYWTINDPERMRELLALGADGLVTDRADLARSLRDAALTE